MAFLVILLSGILHPFHLSVTNVYYKADEKVVQVEQRIFLDDLEEALRDYTGDQKLNVTEDDQKEISAIIEKYLLEKFQITANGQPIELAYLGNELVKDENVMWCYFEAEKVKKFDSFLVTNSVLTEKFDDQENIIHYTFPNGKKRSERTGVGKIVVQFGE